MRAEAGSGDRFVEEEVEQVHVEDAGFVERAVQHVVAARLQSEQPPAGHDRREESAAFDRGIEMSVVDRIRSGMSSAKFVFVKYRARLESQKSARDLHFANSALQSSAPSAPSA